MTSQHTILLSQYNASPESRIWEDYDAVSQAIDGVIQMFERHLKKKNPDRKQITYDLKDLFAYLDELKDVGIMIFLPKKRLYMAKGREWIKSKVLNHLKQQVISNEEENKTAGNV